MEAHIAELYKPLFQYIRKRINDQLDAEDLTQEVFYKLAKSDIGNLENVKSWVYTIAKNTIIDYYRKKKIQTEDVGDLNLEAQYNEDHAVEELSNCITPYVNALPETYRQIMQLSELENKSQKEIATLLKINYVTVRSKIQRGRMKLKELFSKCCSIKQGGKGSIMDYIQNEGCKTGGTQASCSQEDKC